MFLNAAFEGCRRTWVICDPIYWALSLMATTVNLQCFPIFEMQNKNCWSCPQKFYECIGAGGHELYKRATVNVNKSNRGDPTFENASQIVVNIFWVHWCRRTWVIRAGPILGSFLARNSCYILQRTNNINIDPRVTITPNNPFSKWQIQRKLQRQIERQCQGQWQMDY